MLNQDMPSPKNKSQRPEAVFLTSASQLEQCPQDDVLEVALAGRSNAGKSSFLNCFSRGGDVAKVSRQPGKTRILNFFNVGEKYRLVDMPGFGYSSRSIKEIMEWRRMIENFLANRTNIVGIVLFLDCRREFEKLEIDLVKWLNSVHLPVVVALSKIDKANKSEIKAKVQKWQKELEIPVFAISSEKAEGVFELEDWVYKNWVHERV